MRQGNNIEKISVICGIVSQFIRRFHFRAEECTQCTDFHEKEVGRERKKWLAVDLASFPRSLQFASCSR